ncbi:ABC-type glycerol-3-phosphate transport system substrate-binding protein [Salirhabdus euzebyi]|uniref:ABC-type glycerol-3-phosphate transport system substrate-binding protein n=1 Tax=Salirhabdus euzebyi TaxID=394506 RepID=A0A841Q881_9BACI|nr:ABC transporter substrate-binding protein [Salirhabdus euzebyi]MBB6454606.1 ABC-type glycerol-3-phosphate transport system substrate-binding protein [Salirhabdus euzebyi]
MKLKLLFLLSISIIIICIFYIVDLLNQDFVLNKEDEYDSTINIWITSSGLAPSLDQFENEYNVKVNVRQFNDKEALMEELTLSNVTSELPDVIEVNDHDGMDEIVKQYDVYPIERISSDLLTQFHPSIHKSFTYQDKLYAYPLGMEIPLLFVNESLLRNHYTDGETLFPFEKHLGKYKEIQDKINENNNIQPFWLFHFDEQIPFYWEAKVASTIGPTNASFDDMWNDLVNVYQLVPPLDNHMAITRFANLEVGALVSTSVHLQTVQELIGNSFEFDVIPFIPNSYPILVSGHGLVVMNENEMVDELFTFLNKEEIQLQFLGKNGWLPAAKTLMEDTAFVHDLPMSKYISELLQYEHLFIGTEIEEASRESWTDIKNKAIEIEK